MLDFKAGYYFPRSKERGLIEACVPRMSQAERLSFPRSKERGLIEANLLSHVFRLTPAFPRSKERGLIEAFPLHPIERQQLHFPSSKERGLIEARQADSDHEIGRWPNFNSFSSPYSEARICPAQVGLTRIFPSAKKLRWASVRGALVLVEQLYFLTC